MTEAAIKTLREYDENPYIIALPPMDGAKAFADRLASPPSFDSSERDLSPILRRHAVHRLHEYFRPTSRHLVFAEEFDILLRRGYVGRDPTEGVDGARIVEVADQAADDLLLSRSRPLKAGSTAKSATLVGVPGVGKTHTVNHLLRSYPQVIEHSEYPTQIVWIKLDTPVKGSLRALCVDFFRQVDILLGHGEKYTRLFAGISASEESMMNHMAIVANYHALGCLLIDEIQHLPKREDEHELLTFVVTLTNKIGVPVLFIGTMKALKMFSGSARMSRRSVGTACSVWSNYAANDKGWQAFIKDLWQYQWTSEHTLLDEGMLAMFHHHTQGVVDIAVKLFAMIQTKVILRGQAGSGRAERIDASIVDEIMHRDFAPARGFLDALRSGDIDRIAKYDDLDDFTAGYSNAMRALDPSRHAQIAISKPERRIDNEDAARQDVPDRVDTFVQVIKTDLLERKFAMDVIELAIDQTLDALGTEVTLKAMLVNVEKLVAPKKPKRGGSVPLDWAKLPDLDLRRLALEAAESGRAMSEALADRGLGGHGALSLAA